MKQFWSLFKFQTKINPFIWFMPIAFGIPLFIPTLVTSSVSGSYHPGFYSLFTGQNLIFVGIFGTMVLAPEKFQFGGTNIASGYYGSEFMLTRAIDRPVLYRAKAAVLYLLVLSMPIIVVLTSLQNPDLIVSEYAKPVQQLCLAQVPGSTMLPATNSKTSPSLISIPRGSVLVAMWQLWMLVVVAITLQLLLMFLYPLRYGKWAFWVLYFGLIFIPLFDIGTVSHGMPSINERLFFSFSGHQTLYWILTAGIFTVTQLWCERRFAQLEQ